MARLFVNDRGETVVADFWGADDIQSVAVEELDLEDGLTDEQIKRVMETIVEGYDSNIGINWAVISCAIDIVLEDEK